MVLTFYAVVVDYYAEIIKIKKNKIMPLRKESFPIMKGLKVFVEVLKKQDSIVIISDLTIVLCRSLSGKINYRKTIIIVVDMTVK